MRKNEEKEKIIFQHEGWKVVHEQINDAYNNVNMIEEDQSREEDNGKEE